jgi:hypothetical protein
MILLDSMQIEYRTSDNNEHFLQYMNALWKENWIYCGEKWDKLVFYREIPKERKARVILTGDDFEDFYKLYPRKIAKKDAQVMWKRLDEKTKLLAIEWLRRYIVYWEKKGIETQYLPYPASWINGKRWDDKLDDSKPKLAIEEKYKQEQEEDRKIEEDRKWMDSQLAKLKQSWKWDEWHNQAREETPEWQRQYEMIILARLKKRLSNNPL